jgi:hypothetical protein
MPSITYLQMLRDPRLLETRQKHVLVVIGLCLRGCSLTLSTVARGGSARRPHVAGLQLFQRLLIGQVQEPLRALQQHGVSRIVLLPTHAHVIVLGAWDHAFKSNRSLLL